MSAPHYQFYAGYYEGNKLEAAAQWVQGLLLGQVGTTVAVVAVAVAGMNMLWGRISVKGGAQILLGCFILFGAPAIARGLMGGVEGAVPIIATEPPRLISANQSPLAVSTSPPISINPFDPYTGASPGN